MKTVIYARYSTDRQDSRSIDDQVRRCREFAAARGWTVGAVYRDAAQSGAHMDRADMRRMLQAAQRREFDAVVVDDLSRLSRDLGNTWRIVFEELAAVCVRVIDATTGMSSDGAGARLTFGAMALVNDTFLQLVRTETHRGMEGRALAGFSTGGRTYGYTSVPEEAPPDPEHPRRLLSIDAVEAEVVRGIYSDFVAGVGYKRISNALNVRGVVAPHDGGRGHKVTRGWGPGTIRAILMNERYTGRVVWNRTKWVRVPGKRSRRQIERPESEWRVQEAPELQIVSDGLWRAAQSKIRRGRKRGRPVGSGKSTFLLAGLLKCGSCDGLMGVVGQKIRRGERYRSIGCIAHASRGASICANGRTVSERKIVSSVLDSIFEELRSPEVVSRIVDRAARRLAAHNRELAAAVDGSEIGEAERRVANATEAIVKMGYSEALHEALRREESRLAQLRVRVEGARTVTRLPLSERQVEKILGSMTEALRASPERSREVLSRHLTPLTMSPTAYGYNYGGGFRLSVSDKDGSGGPQTDLSETFLILEIRGVAA